MINKLSILLALTISVTTPVWSQQNSVYVDIAPCMAMTDNVRRHACYDLLEQQVRAAEQRAIELPVVSLPGNIPATQSAVDIAIENKEPAQQSSVDGFGRETPATSRNRDINAQILANDDGEQELVDTIAELRERVPGQWQITLTSGQIWNQINSKTYRLREGMQVRIYLSPFGGTFRLSATNMNGFIQVHRIQ